MAIEDFTTYSLTDPGSRFTVTASRSTAAAFQTRNEGAWLISDKGAGHFVDYKHHITIFESATGASQFLVCWMLSNTVGDQRDANIAGAGQYVGIHGGAGSSYNVNLEDVNLNTDTYAGAASTLYYLTLERVGTTLTCKIYSDAGRTTLLDTLSITCVNTTWRYVTVTCGHNSSSNAFSVNGYVENLNLTPSTSILRQMMNYN